MAIYGYSQKNWLFFIISPYATFGYSKLLLVILAYFTLGYFQLL